MSADFRLYFLRHGLADRAEFDGADDDLRPLTDAGKQRLEQQGRFLARMGLKVDVVLTSPLVRARQTAEIVARRLGVEDRLRADKRLDLGFDPERLAAILAELADSERRVMLVGHEPGFSEVIGEITGGSMVVCRKGSLARVDIIDRDELLGLLVWLLPPKAMLA
jgi:phosphohistidine phosphatase